MIDQILRTKSFGHAPYFQNENRNEKQGNINRIFLKSFQCELGSFTRTCTSTTVTWGQDQESGDLRGPGFLGVLGLKRKLKRNGERIRRLKGYSKFPLIRTESIESGQTGLRGYRGGLSPDKREITVFVISQHGVLVAPGESNAILFAILFHRSGGSEYKQRPPFSKDPKSRALREYPKSTRHPVPVALITRSIIVNLPSRYTSSLFLFFFCLSMNGYRFREFGQIQKKKLRYHRMTRESVFFLYCAASIRKDFPQQTIQ